MRCTEGYSTPGGVCEVHRGVQYPWGGVVPLRGVCEVHGGGTVPLGGVCEVHGGGTVPLGGGWYAYKKYSHLILPQIKVTLKPRICFLQAKCRF